MSDPGAAPIAPRDAEERSLLADLAHKYERMQALRGRLGRGPPAPEDRELLRALAADYPGALRELETLSTSELAERAASARAARGAALVPAWLLWTALYHALTRRLLHRRRMSVAEGGERAGTPHGRLNVLVFAALESRFAVPQRIIWDRLFPSRGSAPRPERA